MHEAESHKTSLKFCKMGYHELGVKIPEFSHLPADWHWAVYIFPLRSCLTILEIILSPRFVLKDLGYDLTVT